MKTLFHTCFVMYSLLSATTKLGRYCRPRGVAGFSAGSKSIGRTRQEALRVARENVEDLTAPWNDPTLEERAKGKNGFRARQHVNPLAEKFQRPTELSPEWPADVFDDLSKPLFLDIGCSRGGFLVDIAKSRPDDYNYLGLEIRPIVVYLAKERIQKHKLQGRLDFVGCNANVDLERLLNTADAKGKLQIAAIQFPDPHFKERHKKRRVVTPELVTTLAKFMPEGAIVFLQSDIQSVLDEMRHEFRQQEQYFNDDVANVEEYQEENFTGHPTEREVSVLEKGLPVYRTTFTRTSVSASEE